MNIPPPFSWCLETRSQPIVYIDNATNIIRSVNFRTSNPLDFQCNIIDTKLKNVHGDKVQIAPRASHLYNFTSILTIRKPPHVGAFKEEQNDCRANEIADNYFHVEILPQSFTSITYDILVHP